MKKATLAIRLCKKKKRTDGTYPVKLRVTFAKVQKFYAIGKYYFDDDTFQAIMKPSSKGEKGKLRKKLNKILHEAEEVVEKLSVFSFEAFERRYLNKRGTWSELFATFDMQIKTLEENDQIGTASTYRTALYSFKKYKPRLKTIDLKDITPEFLLGYERWMKKAGRSATTISMNTRCLRRLFNLAIAEGDVHKDYYPFGSAKDGKYQPPKVRNPKKAISKEDIRKLLNYKPDKGSTEHFNRDIWILSYLCGGINTADIFRLKYRDISSSDIVFLRKKTDTHRNLRPVRIPLNDEIQAIIDLWGNKPIKADSYVFPVLSKGLTSKQEHARSKQGTKQVNTYVREVAAKVGIEEHLTSYTARHSFASILALSDQALPIISAMMGHSSSVVTQLYINDTEIDEKRKAMSQLL